PRGPECSGHRLRVDCVLARTKCRCSVLVPVRHLASELANSPDLRDPRHSLRPIHPVGVNLASALLPLRRPHLDDALPSLLTSGTGSTCTTTHPHPRGLISVGRSPTWLPDWSPSPGRRPLKCRAHARPRAFWVSSAPT